MLKMFNKLRRSETKQAPHAVLATDMPSIEVDKLPHAEAVKLAPYDIISDLQPSAPPLDMTTEVEPDWCEIDHSIVSELKTADGICTFSLLDLINIVESYKNNSFRIFTPTSRFMQKIIRFIGDKKQQSFQEHNDVYLDFVLEFTDTEGLEMAFQNDESQHNKNIIDKELKLLKQMDDLSKQGHLATVKAISSFREVLINRLLSRGQDPTEMGLMYYHGTGTEKNYKEAIKWFKLGAEQNHAVAQNYLGSMYHFGDGVEQDFDKAFEWYNKSADQGNIVAQANLGQMYYHGRSVEKDFSKAVEWYTKAAEQGCAPAQNALGWIYHYGESVEKDLDKAVEWYAKAAEQGHSAAKKNLGLLSKSTQKPGLTYRGKGLP